LYASTERSECARSRIAAAGALLDQEHQLLKGQLAACRVDARDRSRVTRVHIPEVVERLLGTELREQDPVRLHAQAGLEKLRRHASEAFVHAGVGDVNNSVQLER
jgi:hypothetical protein